MSSGAREHKRGGAVMTRPTQQRNPPSYIGLLYSKESGLGLDIKEVYKMQLSFEGMLEEVDKELHERSHRLKVEHIENCDRSCITSKKNKSYKEVQLVTEAIGFLVDYFKKYSPDSVWGKWIQDYYHVKVTI